MKNQIIIITILVLVIPKWMKAQDNNPSSNKDWVINEVYVSEAPTRYGLFIELYNPSSPEFPSDLYISTTKDHSDQYRLRTRLRYHPDQRQRQYRAFKVSTIRYKRKSIRIYEKPDTVYLFKRVNYEFEFKDAFPILWNDSLSLGRCGNRICYFNIPTPGRVNKNVKSVRYMPRRGYRLAILGGSSSAINTGFSNGVGRIPSFIIKGQKIVNRRLFYTTSTASIYSQGYYFNNTTDTTTSNGYLIRNVNGYYASIGISAGKEIGIYLTPRIDLSCGASLVIASYTRQIYNEHRTFTPTNSATTQEDIKQNQRIGNYPLPVLTFNSGLNYQLTPKLKIELSYNILFRTFEKSGRTYFHSLNIGLSTYLTSKGRGYRDGLLW